MDMDESNLNPETVIVKIVCQLVKSVSCDICSTLKQSILYFRISAWPSQV